MSKYVIGILFVVAGFFFVTGGTIGRFLPDVVPIAMVASGSLITLAGGLFLNIKRSERKTEKSQRERVPSEEARRRLNEFLKEQQE